MSELTIPPAELPYFLSLKSMFDSKFRLALFPDFIFQAIIYNC